MASRTKSAQMSGYSTIKIENTESLAMLLYVTAPNGVEFFIARLEPGDSTVQFTPVGATWSLRPEVSEKQFVAQAGENIFKAAEASTLETPPSTSTRKGRGGASVTSTVRP